MAHSEDRQLVDGYLKEMDENLGSGILSLDEDGLCVFDIDGKGRFRFEVPEAGGHCYLASPLTMVPLEGERRNELLTNALLLNFFGKGTQNATLSLDPETGIIHLHYALKIEFLNAITLENTFSNFVDLAVKVKNSLEGNETAEAAPATEQAPTEELAGFGAMANPTFGGFA
ncbi:CesT family type III secretion system chaperone [Acanthopleuribacter pedis]|uniref:Type III secretion system chaperone n=1 Tax=Acanthopleuribacter pedis TaxID=442870 RepID=A0A8J7QFY3_9BACT|nr:CesT family type III secretion system chaperone [Acanthopleuribacter pedis]MBO1319280.1 type III secretion system chaperone [Acanthopleuribacter pedis]